MSAEMRLSDAERDEAINALSEHVKTGRLDLDEFGERSAKVTTAKTRGDLAPLFADLPAPHPSVLSADVRPASSRPSPAVRFNSGLLPIAVFVALALYFTVARGMWLVFLLPVVVLLVTARKR